MNKTRCYVALGANLGEPIATVRAAISALRELPGTQLVSASSLYRTAPVGLKHQPDFINAVVAIDTGEAEVAQGATLLRRSGSAVQSRHSAPPPRDARNFIQALFRIEEMFGRQREPSGARNLARTLDLDLLLYGDQINDDPSLTLPHPRMHHRAFVLAPLAEIAPDLMIPGRGCVASLLKLCVDQRIERLP